MTIQSYCSATYCTSYCNQAHVVKTGRPVAHECYILPPAALKAEIFGNTEQAQAILHGWSLGPRRTVKGR